MTTVAGKKPVKSAARGKKPTARAGDPLRIREELLPDSARYVTIDDIEYVAIPVAGFQDWYEDVEDRIALEEARENREPGTPIEAVMAELGIKPKGKR